ncbi:MAG: tetratricopeptide repeat protein, partial [Planctomycetia bacterium]|nr:tetratricopeptide repeat protein [Planctomycetia bacterium]
DRPGGRPSGDRPSMDRPGGRPQPPGRPGENYRPGPRPPHFAPPPPPPPHHTHHGPGHYRPYYRPYYYYDPYRYHYGYAPIYRPVYPWWLDAAYFGAGFAVGYSVRGDSSVYYYYPESTTSSEPVVIDNSTIIINDGEDELFEPIPIDDRGRSILNDDLNLSEDAVQDDDSFLLQDAPAAPSITKEDVDAAWKKIQEADEKFGKGEISEAISAYESVTEDLSLIPDPWFRLAFAESARNNYDKAMDHMNRGLELSRTWPASPFSLDYMYRGADERKETNLRTLQTATKNSPDNADLNLLTGLTLYSNGQTEEAKVYLENAGNLMPDLKEFVEPMLKNIEESGTMETGGAK